MRARTEKLVDVTAAELEQVVKEYEAAGSTDVVATRQPDGRWTVTALLPVDEGTK